MTGIRLNIETSQAKGQIDSMSDSLGELTDKLKEATEAGNWKDAANLTFAMNNLQAAQKQTLQMANQQAAQQSKEAQAGQANVGNNIVNISNQASGAVSTLASGNYAGAVISSTRNAGGALRSFGKDFAAKEGGEGLGKILGALGVVGMVGSAVMAGGNALSEQYENSLGAMNSLNKTFGGMTNLKTAAQNNSQAMDFYQQLKDEANKIGMALDDFAEVVVDMSKYGVGNYNKAKAMSLNAGQWANFTNSDITTLQNFQGLTKRYGNDENSLKTAYGGAMASGLGKGQYEEYLVSIQKIIEDGIANGYMKSTEDIANNLTMLARLSGGNELWKGEQGVNRLMKMNQGISGAVELQSVSDMIIANAAKSTVETMRSNGTLKNAIGGKDRNGRLVSDRETGTYLDYMLLMEQGTNPEMFGNIVDSIKALEGDNVTGQVEQFRKAFKLNYAGAIDIYNMTKDLDAGSLTKEQFQKRVVSMQTDANYMSDEQKKQQMANDIHAIATKIGKGAFDIKMAGLGKLEDITQSIYNYLARDTPDVSDLYDKGEGGGFFTPEYKTQFQSSYKNNPELFTGFGEWLYSLSSEELAKINASNLLNIDMTAGNPNGINDFNAQWKAIRDAGGIDAYQKQNIRPERITKALGQLEADNWGNPVKHYFAHSLLRVNSNKEQEIFDNGALNGFENAFSTQEDFKKFLNSKGYKFDAFKTAYYTKYANPDRLTQEYLDNALPIEKIKSLYNDAINEYKKNNQVGLIEEVCGLREDLRHLTITLS